MPAIVIAIGPRSPRATKGVGCVTDSYESDAYAITAATSMCVLTGGSVVVSAIGENGEYLWCAGPIPQLGQPKAA
jgi:hypothetical protein